MDPATANLAAKAFTAAVASDTGPLLSGNAGAFDARSFFDGSGWTVSTGRSSATGARDSRTGSPYGPGLGEASSSPMQAGASPLMLLALASVAAGFLLTRKG